MESNLCVTEELLGFKSMHGTTIGEEIFEVSKCVTEMKLDGAPESLCERKNNAELHESKFLWELAFMCDVTSHVAR